MILYSNPMILASAAVVSSMICAASSAQTCSLRSADTSSVSRQVRVYDEDMPDRNGNPSLVWSGQVYGGQTITIKVSDKRGRFEYKYAQDRGFHSNTGFWCNNGDTMTF